MLVRSADSPGLHVDCIRLFCSLWCCRAWSGRRRLGHCASFMSFICSSLCMISFFASPGSEWYWTSAAILLRSSTDVIFLAMLDFILEFDSPGESLTLASMRPLWVAGLSVALGLSKVRFIFWPLSVLGVVGMALMEGSRITTGLNFFIFSVDWTSGPFVVSCYRFLPRSIREVYDASSHDYNVGRGYVLCIA